MDSLVKNINDVCLIVQARLGSTRVQNKMMRKFSDTTLIDLVISKLKTSKVIPQENIYMSVWDEKLKDVANKHNVNIYHRSEESAKSEGGDLSVLFEWWNKLPYKYVVLVSACNPLLKIETVDSFIEKFMNTDSDGCFGVIEKKTYYWNESNESITDWKGLQTMNTKFVEPTYEAAHCLYASRMDIIGDGNWMDKNYPPQPELFVMDELETFDIDYEWQFEIGELLYARHN
tara:strand:+ start:177 stop:869 length:693 start_codon:yes stop_codon:yes gene_type:complete